MLEEQVTEGENGEMHLKGVMLHVSRQRRAEHHKYVSDKREISAVTNEVIPSLIEFLTQRFPIDEERLSTLKSFTNLTPDADLKSVNAILASDLNLEALGLEYDELMQMEDIEAFRKASLGEKVKLLAHSEHYTTVNKVLARVLAANLTVQTLNG